MSNRTLPIKLLTTALMLAVLLAACGAGAEPTPTSTPLPAASASGQTVEGQRTFNVIPSESKVSYLVDEEFFDGALSKLGIKAGLVDVVGSTQEITGQLQLNLDDLSQPLGTNEFSVNLTGLSTDQSRRDDWIQNNGPEFTKFPVATFLATSIEGAPDSYNEGDEVNFKLAGDLTIREVTQPVTFDVTAKLEGATLSGTASTRLLMSDFGIDPPSFANTLTVQDEFGLEVNIIAREE